MKLQLNNKNFELKFGFGVFFILGRFWQLPDVQAVLNKLAQIDNIGENVNLDSIEILADVVKACIAANKNNGVSMDEIDTIEIIEFLLENTDIIASVVTEIVNSMPKSNQEKKAVGKPIPGAKK